VLAVLPSNSVRIFLGQPQLLDLLHQRSLVQVVLGSVGHDEVHCCNGALREFSGEDG
jgi:hypothetical protein